MQAKEQSQATEQFFKVLMAENEQAALYILNNSSIEDKKKLFTMTILF